MRSVLSWRLVVLCVLCLLTLLAAGPGSLSAQPGREDPVCGPGYCVGSSYCDNCLCYHPDHWLSQLYCGGGGGWIPPA